MRLRSVIGAAVLLAGLSGGIGVLPAQDPPATEPEASYGTPQAAFKAFTRGVKNKDFKTIFSCLTPESRSLLTGQLVMSRSVFQMMTKFDKDGKMKDKLTELDKLFAKHGLTKETLEKIKKENKPGKDSKDEAKAMRALAAPVKNQVAFATAMMAWMEAADPSAKTTYALEDARLENLKVTGDKATASVVTKGSGKESPEPMDFVKVKGSWLIVMPMPRRSQTKIKESPPNPAPVGKN